MLFRHDLEDVLAICPLQELHPRLREKTVHCIHTKLLITNASLAEFNFQRCISETLRVSLQDLDNEMLSVLYSLHSASCPANTVSCVDIHLLLNNLQTNLTNFVNGVLGFWGAQAR